jgi:hypothetical protein
MAFSSIQKEARMRPNASIVAAFETRQDAEDGIKRLATSGFTQQALSIVATGSRTEEQVVGLYSAGDRFRFWGKLGLLWGGFWGLAIGGVLFAVPAADGFQMSDFVGDALVAAVEGALIIGSIAAVGTTLYSFGRPSGSVLKYGSVAKAGTYIVVFKGSDDDAAAAKRLLPSGSLAAPAGVTLFQPVQA